MASISPEPNQVLLKLVDTVIPTHCDNISMFDCDLVLSSFKNGFKKTPKFTVLYNHVLNNFFLSNEKKKECLLYFFDIQRKYLYLLTFVRIVKLNLQKHSKNDELDLFFNDLSCCSPRFKIVIFEQNSKYTFNVIDLLHIICSALSNHDDLFVTPCEPKNPYTNLPFTYCNLFNIYAFCTHHCIIIPNMLTLYFQSNFNVLNMRILYEPVLRENAILSYYKNMSMDTKYTEVLDILRIYKHIIPLRIHNEFSREQVVAHLGKCILLYLESEYSLIPMVKYSNTLALTNFLKTFYLANKTFGTLYFLFGSNQQHDNCRISHGGDHSRIFVFHGNTHNPRSVEEIANQLRIREMLAGDDE